MLQIYQHKMERKILHVSRKDRMTNEEVRRNVGPDSRMTNGSETKMRWADDFRKTAGTQWSTQARSRATGRPELLWHWP